MPIGLLLGGALLVVLAVNYSPQQRGWDFFKDGL
jgi:hypothetical protein